VWVDLPRIRSLGVDVVWLMPIHPIGEDGRKGSRGSPYSIADYREINPEYGTKEDFAELVEMAHRQGLKVMIDAVLNHTARDARLAREHPEWYHQDAHGRPVTTVPEWSDVIDLKYGDPTLEDELIDTLKGWVAGGVDGFRCDVASLVPLEFWRRARQEVARVNPATLWLAESVHASWVAERRRAGLRALSDAELYQAFDLTYPYDSLSIWQAAVRGEVPLERYLEFLRLQDCIYPAHYAKLRCVENHDQPRILALAPTREQALAWTACEAFNQGAFLIYAGQEMSAAQTPSLFEVDPIRWDGEDLQPYISQLARLKKDPAQVQGDFVLLEAGPAIQAAWLHAGQSLFGLFNPAAATGPVAVHLPDGDYADLLGGEPLRVRSGMAALPAGAAIVRAAQVLDARPFYTPLLDYRA
jgi:glycosidase